MKSTIKIVGLLFLAILSAGSRGINTKQDTGYDPWVRVDSILKQIEVPVFPNRNFLVTSYGAVGDGKTNCTVAFAKAIDACVKAGGGKVIIPKGRFFCGPIHLKSGVNLHLQSKATILFSTNPKDYLPLVYTRWEGVELMNYSPLIYAYEQDDIAITGSGTLDGQGSNEHWWSWKGKEAYGWKEGLPQQQKGRDQLFDMGEKSVPARERVFGEGYFLRPQFIQPYRCKNILIEGITIINSPMWIIHPVLCSNVTINKVIVNSNGPNNDGCDPESCKNVLIKNCFFNTGDDCIALKSGRNTDGRKIGIACENIVVQNCKMANGHGGVVIGSEISGGARNVFAEDCSMDSPELDRVLRIKTSSNRGGVIEDIYIRNIQVGQVKEEVVLATMFYEDSGAYVPVIRNIGVQNVKVAKGGKYGFVLEGYASSPVKNVAVENCIIAGVKKNYKFTAVENVSFKNVVVNGDTVRFGWDPLESTCRHASLSIL